VPYRLTQIEEITAVDLDDGSHGCFCSSAFWPAG
jgi:DNA-binding PucR family transcriptional regulator